MNRLRNQARERTKKGRSALGRGIVVTTLSNSANYFMIFQIQENGDNNNYPNDGSGLTQDRTITFTNSGVSNTDLQIAISVVNR